jgi:hypothetical protein
MQQYLRAEVQGDIAVNPRRIPFQGSAGRLGAEALAGMIVAQAYLAAMEEGARRQLGAGGRRRPPC